MGAQAWEKSRAQSPEPRHLRSTVSANILPVDGEGWLVAVIDREFPSSLPMSWPSLSDTAPS